MFMKIAIVPEQALDRRNAESAAVQSNSVSTNGCGSLLPSFSTEADTTCILRKTSLGQRSAAAWFESHFRIRGNKCRSAADRTRVEWTCWIRAREETESFPGVGLQVSDPPRVVPDQLSPAVQGDESY